VRFRVLEIHRGKWQQKEDDKPILRPSEYIKIQATLEKNESKFGAPLMNNYFKGNINKNKARIASLNPQLFESQVNQLIKSKNTLENSNAEQVDTFIFNKNDESLTSSQK